MLRDEQGYMRVQVCLCVCECFLFFCIIGHIICYSHVMHVRGVSSGNCVLRSMLLKGAVTQCV